MWLTSSEQEVVNLFWKLCGEKESFPRNLERPLALALPVALIKLPQLKLRDIENWMNKRGLTFNFECDSRFVRGCLIAHAGQGILFIDGTDPIDEQRFTLAHEIAHFLIDYWLPRTKAIEKFGLSVAEIVDGLRPPTVTERLQAIFSSIQIGPYKSLMEREGSQENLSILDSENRADCVALTLLAPSKSILPLLNLSSSQYEVRHQITVNILRKKFGLPNSVAISYGHVLLKSIDKGPSWVESLRLK